jgi:2-phosphosulfolactate phosphatase
MRCDVVLLPRDFAPEHARGTVVVFDVLRATTSITAALASGAKEVHVFGSLDEVRQAAPSVGGLLCGESKCLRPEGFDLGNSPGDYTSEIVTAKTVLLATTNGTRALVAARHAQHLLVGSLVNAAGVARKIADLNQPVTLLCSGTEGAVSMEDLIGCGAVIEEVGISLDTLSDTALIAHHLFLTNRADLASALRQTRGGRNIIAAGLEPDIEFCARLNSFETVGICDGRSLSVRAL